MVSATGLTKELIEQKIKDISNRTVAGIVIPAKDVPAWSQGKEYLEEAIRVLEDANKYAAELAAHEKLVGYKDGFQSGTQSVIDVVAKAKRSVDVHYAGLERNMVDLSLQVVRQILDNIVPAESITATVRKTLQTLDVGNEIVLHVSPQIIEPLRQKLIAELPADAEIKITLREDAKLNPTDCRLLGSFGTVDLSIDKQFEILSASLRAAGLGLRS